MRTFHIGGAASRAAVASGVEAKSNGTVRFTSTMRYVTNAKGEQVAIGRSGEVTIVDDNGRERERHKVPYGATLLAADGKQVKAGTQLASWDPLTRPIVTEFAGTVKFENVEEGVTVARQIDEVTGLSTLVVIDAKRRGPTAAKGVRPQVKLSERDGRRGQDPRHRALGDDQLPGGCADCRARRAASGRRRSAGADSDRIAEDARHHRRSAASCRAVRSAFTERRRHAGRGDGHGDVRQGNEGQAAPDHHGSGRRRA